MTKSLKIVNSVFGDASGGRWNAMMNMSNALESKGHKLIVVASQDNKKLDHYGRKIEYFSNSGFYDFWSAYKIKRWLDKERPDVILAHSGRAVCLFKNAMLFGGKEIPVIAINHSHNVKRTVRADGFIHITPHVAECVAEASGKKGIDLSKKPQAVISNLVYLPEQKPIFSSSLKNPPVLGIMTRLVDYKGTHLLIDAVALLKQKGCDVRLLIAGEGEEKNILMEQTSRLGLKDQVEFLGWIGGDAKIKFYQDIDIAVVPTMNDTQPLAILDAFSWGKPVVASDHISVQQIIRDGENGLMAKCGDSESLAEKIYFLIENPNKFKKYAETAFSEVIDEYQFSKIAEKLNKFLLSI